MNIKKTGLTLGAFAGLVHLVWSLMVGLGIAQGYMNFVLKMHFLNNPYIVQPFNLGNALVLIVLTAVIGYIVGAVFATIYNKFHK